MAEKRKPDPVEEQKKRQNELIELKKRQQEIKSNPEAFVCETGSVAVQSTKSKLSNFWYYSKNTIIFIIIIAIILAIGVSQCVNRTDYDLTIVLNFKRYVSPAMIDNIAKTAGNYCKDYNGDGEVNVLVMDCAFSDNELMTDMGQAKSSRLMSQLMNEEAIVYIVDKDALLNLDTVAGGVFVDDSLNLPEYDGKAFKLNGSCFDDAFNKEYEGFTNDFEYYIVRRTVDGTMIDGKSDVKKHSQQGNELIRSIMADPKLENTK